MSDDRSRRVFSWIAPIYGLFYRRQVRHYEAVLDAVRPEVDLGRHASILDVGCGTGALCAVLSRRGHETTGVESVQRMLDIAEGHALENPVTYVRASVLDRLPFEDGRFDVAMACYVAHGLSAADRRTMYAEMARVARSLVILHDYNERRSLLTDIAERLEGGDYFAFIRTVRSELLDAFAEVRVIPVGPMASWYVCVPRSRYR